MRVDCGAFAPGIYDAFGQHTPISRVRRMLHRDAPFGLARYRGLAEPFSEPQPRKYTAPGAASRHSKTPSAAQQSHGGLLPEDIMVIIIAYLNVADTLVVRRVSL